MTVFKGYKGARESVKWYLMTRGMWNAEQVNKYSHMSSVSPDNYWQRNKSAGVQLPHMGLTSIFTVWR